MRNRYLNFFLSLIFIATFLRSIYAIPHRKPDEGQPNTPFKLSHVPELKKLGKYVCNDHANTFKRFVDPGEIIVSATTIQQLLAEIKVIELKLASLLPQQPPTPGPPAITSPSIDIVVETVIPLPLGLPSPTVYSEPYSAPANSIDSADWTTTINIMTTSTVYETTQPPLTTSNSFNEPVSNSTATNIPPITSLTPGSPPPIPPSPPIFPSQIFKLTPPEATSPSPVPSQTVIPVPTINENPPQSKVQSSNDVGSAGDVHGKRYHFDPRSSSNIAVYYGQTPATSTTPLTTLCSDPTLDIIILAFLTSDSDSANSKYPTVNFGSTCGGQTPQMKSEAPGLLYCPELAAQISTCQMMYGKKGLLSLGGSTGRISFGSVDKARGFADVLWGLFGPSGGSVESGLRPFGGVEVDGFDIDNEDNMPQYLGVLASTLRSHFDNASKEYYLSSAPQCPIPDASNPLSLLLLLLFLCDFVFIQFYNNPSCEIGSSGFIPSLQQWSSALSASTLPRRTRMYLGAPAWSEAAPGAYKSIGGPEGMKGVVGQVRGVGLRGFGGVMFWDGSQGELNLGGGKSVFGWAKEGLLNG